MWQDNESDKDFLNFTEVADQAAALVTDPNLLPISIGIFGGWGTGKSTVLKLTEKQLQASEDIILIKFDAWLYQGFDDSRAALMEVIATRLLDEAEGQETLLDKAKSIAKRVNYFRAIGKIAEYGVGAALGIPPGFLTSAGNAIASIVAGKGSESDTTTIKDAGSSVRDELSKWIAPQEKRTPPEEINAFRKEFSELLAGLNKTLVVFIDNLDRCLPDVAIATLEAIRLFLFMPRTAFVIAADEGMIRHSVAKHFNDPQDSHVRDYLDKVIQVPMRVPQVGEDDIRAYMYSLFVHQIAKAKLEDTQKALLHALQNSWNGARFTKENIFALCGRPQGLLDRLAIADRLAPILARAPKIQGNPRTVKRLLNSIVLRETLARKRSMSVDLATLAKLAIFERCTNETATLKLFNLITQANGEIAEIQRPQKGEPSPLPVEWKGFEDFIVEWCSMEPEFGKENLKPAVFLSRDVLAPAPVSSGLSDKSVLILKALLKIPNANSPASKKIIADIAPGDRSAIMAALIESMRKADWTTAVAVEGAHGAILLAQAYTETGAALKDFFSQLPQDRINKGMQFVIKKFLNPT